MEGWGAIGVSRGVKGSGSKATGGVVATGQQGAGRAGTVGGVVASPGREGLGRIGGSRGWGWWVVAVGAAGKVFIATKQEPFTIGEQTKV
ncbi:Aggrecan core protein [Bienertia sinuspersici]